jgi:hypothetical protein
VIRALDEFVRHLGWAGCGLALLYGARAIHKQLLIGLDKRLDRYD